MLMPKDFGENLGLVVVGKTTASWTDADAAQFAPQLSHLATAFRRVESLHFTQRPPDADTAAEMVSEGASELEETAVSTND